MKKIIIICKKWAFGLRMIVYLLSELSKTRSLERRHCEASMAGTKELLSLPKERISLRTRQKPFNFHIT